MQMARLKPDQDLFESERSFRLLVEGVADYALYMLDPLGQLTGGVAHDFNNLLMVVGGSAQVLKKYADDEKSRRAVEAIESAARRGAALTSQLLSFARRQNVNLQTVRLKERIEAVREGLNMGVGGVVQLP